MFWNKKERTKPDYDFMWPDVAADKMTRFARDAELLKPFVELSEEAEEAYNLAMKGLRMAAKDYVKALDQKGLMSR